MLTQPFDILSCSWPRPVEHTHIRWLSEPEWDAPLMPTLPPFHWDILNGEVCWTIDWRKWFKQGTVWWDNNTGGEMRGFHIVFRLRVNSGGILIFWDDDGSMIRRNGTLLHYDQDAHALTRHEIEVQEGDILEVAHWQVGWEWVWGARIAQTDQQVSSTLEDVMAPYLEPIQNRLHHPEGPPLRMFTNGKTPARTIVAIYSLIANGYVPSAVYLFGEDQWDARTRQLFNTLLPFAQIVSSQQVASRVLSVGGARLLELARRHWFVMKTCISLLYAPEDCFLMDDDVFILDRLDDGLAAFQTNDLVYAPDQDNGRGYLATWNRAFAHQGPLRTNKFNAGLYWIRKAFDLRSVASYALRAQPNANQGHLWEQGLIALLYADKNTVELPGQRYFFPLFDGLPGGILGYDYKLNPCGFKCIHFGGLFEKPSDGISLHLMLQLLGRDVSSLSNHDPPPTDEVHTPDITAKPLQETVQTENSATLQAPLIKEEAQQKMGEHPLVSCIMPTRNRREFVQLALAYFARQDYPHLELIILDDGDDHVVDLIPPDPRIRYRALSQQVSIGAKRNMACEMARGAIIAHWDDDDWYAPHRLSYQVAPLLAGQADITGLETACFFDLYGWQVWTCSPALHRRLFVGDVHGGTLVYWRKVWEKQAHYPPISLAEDARFLQQARRKGARLLKLPHAHSFVYLRHGRNAWSFPAGSYIQPADWQCVALDAFLPPADQPFYEKLAAHRTSASLAQPVSINENMPLVSCIMPTYNRRRFITQAIAYFLRQDYPNKELLILDDGTDAVKDLIPFDKCITYTRLHQKLTVGAKRNLACEQAKGSIIAHWDDDDWHAPQRLRYQVEMLLRQNTDLCGINRLLFYDPAKRLAWQYLYAANQRLWLSGSTLCYKRDFWTTNHFANINAGEDARFVWGSRQERITILDDANFHVGIIHQENVSPKRTQGVYWQTYQVDTIQSLLGGDWDFYHLHQYAN